MEAKEDNSLERKVLELTVLYEVSQLLISHSEPKEVVGSILDILHSKMGMERGTLTLIDTESHELMIEVAHGLTEGEMKKGHYELGEGVTGTVVERGESMIIPRVGENPLFLDRTGARNEIPKNDISFICVPIKIGNFTYGALSVDRIFNNEISLEEDVRFLSILAFNVAQAVKISRMTSDEKKRLTEENISLKEKLRERYSQYNIIGRSNKMREVFSMIEQVCESDATVIIRGESGTGKELAANAIHFNSLRAEGPFIKINCAALPENLIESELFGHERGSFTGATEKRIGKFERASSGTIFLDEIGTLNPGAQAKLLRVVQSMELERVGGSKTIKVDVRIIAATNKDLELAIKDGTFREDLYYRLNIFPIYMPPLRERKTDVLLLADFFMESYSKKYKKDIKRISTPAIDALMRYHWPGNVRELENCIERAVILCRDTVLRGNHLPLTLQTPEISNTKTSGSLASAMEALERDMIIDALNSSMGNIAEAARLLSSTERVIAIRVKKYEINVGQYK